MPKPSRKDRAAVRVPHLHLNRLGVWCFRLTVQGKTLQKSLGTRDRPLATMLASRLNWEWSMAKRAADEPTVESILEAARRGRLPKFDVKLPNGVEITGIETDDDLRRAKEFWSHVESIGPIAPEDRPPRSEHRPQPPAKRPKRPFHKATAPQPARESQGRPKRPENAGGQGGDLRAVRRPVRRPRHGRH